MKTPFPFLVILFSIISAFAVFQPALAHGDEPRLEINVDHMNPGGVVDVRGVDFELEEIITLMLVNSQTVIPFGEVTADLDGIFLTTVVLPVDLKEGIYNFLAITDDHNITSPDLAVLGPPIYPDQGGQGQREEEDPLLAPMPTFAPGVVPDGVLTPPSQPASATGFASSWIPSPSFLFGFLIAALLFFMGLRFVRRR